MIQFIPNFLATQDVDVVEAMSSRATIEDYEKILKDVLKDVMNGKNKIDEIEIGLEFAKENGPLEDFTEVDNDREQDVWKEKINLQGSLDPDLLQANDVKRELETKIKNDIEDIQDFEG
ncbi:hypothetical protein R1flu_025820 [Riccia fluitans]|uniref:Uncharacterized protein n=1 Tax=Riccia fluitans TaxID=41844 RepID=A0ABD1Y304_9MARC